VTRARRRSGARQNVPLAVTLRLLFVFCMVAAKEPWMA